MNLNPPFIYAALLFAIAGISAFVFHHPYLGIVLCAIAAMMPVRN